MLPDDVIVFGIIYTVVKFENNATLSDECYTCVMNDDHMQVYHV